MYAFFLDIDGTSFYKNRVSDAVIESINRARSLGHKVFVNSARAYIGMPEQFYEIQFDGYINSYGTEICIDNKFLHRVFLPTDRVYEIAEYAFNNDIKMYFEGEVRIDINRAPEGFLNPQNINEFKQMLGDKKLCKFILPKAPTDEQKATIFKGFAFFNNEGLAAGYDKSFGVKFMENHFNILNDNTVAIGDTGPDIAMATYAGIGVAMGNAIESLKSCVGYETKLCEQDGVAFAIDSIVDGNISAIKK